MRQASNSQATSWISVDERLPEPDVEVLTRYRHPGGEWQVGQHSHYPDDVGTPADFGCAGWLYGSAENVETSHWMPLPAVDLQAQPALSPGPVTQAWVHGISMMQQSVLLAAIRGPDGLAKYGGGAKMLLRWYRRCILLSAMDRKVLANPIDENGGSFTGPSLAAGDDVDHWSERMQEHVNDYLRQVDALPHHYQMHFMHAVEIVGFKHPDPEIRHFWHQLYLRLVHDFHLWPETVEQLDDRLGDTRSGWLNRADLATLT